MHSAFRGQTSISSDNEPGRHLFLGFSRVVRRPLRHGDLDDHIALVATSRPFRPWPATQI